MNALSFVKNEVEKAGCAVGLALTFAAAAGTMAWHACVVGIYKETQEALACAAPVIPELARWTAQALILTSTVASFAVTVALVAIPMEAVVTITTV